MKTPSYSITKSAITVVFPGVGRPVSINSSYSTQFSQAIEFIKKKDWAGLKRVSDFTLSLKQFSGKFDYRDGDCFFNGRKLNNIIANKIKEFWLSGLPVEALVKFLENCILNPNHKAIEELYLFLQKNSFTLTEDGCFLCWRKVDESYLSYHANPDGTRNRNRPGDVIWMDRALCDTNRENTCSVSLHACSWDYLPYYYGGQGRTMMVKINPRNVVSCPVDYSNAKLRVCEYEVLEEILDGESNNILANKGYFSNSNEGIKYYNKRGTDGKFIKL